MNLERFGISCLCNTSAQAPDRRLPQRWQRYAKVLTNQRGFKRGEISVCIFDTRTVIGVLAIEIFYFAVCISQCPKDRYSVWTLLNKLFIKTLLRLQLQHVAFGVRDLVIQCSDPGISKRLQNNIKPAALTKIVCLPFIVLWLTC